MLTAIVHLMLNFKNFYNIPVRTRCFNVGHVYFIKCMPM